jgi:toxin CptA
MFSPQLNVALKPSRALTIILLVAHAASGILLAILPLPVWLKWIGIVVIAIAGWHYVRRYALFNTRTAVRELRLLSDGQLDVLRGDWQSAQLVGEQFVHPMLTIVRCRTESSRWPVSIVIVPDMLDAEIFRALRVRLKWRG